jgi:hypothetical protein
VDARLELNHRAAERPVAEAALAPGKAQRTA